ncbi:hypothetical protein A6X20_31775 [Bradyrhizobium elkanii]|nr:hypothetical protein A6X20_31775 [Bradyrhizobium elkanii]ODM85931.1 hypothetical protein A6452_00135 [Bradyrhizobium elkanii]
MTVGYIAVADFDTLGRRLERLSHDLVPIYFSEAARHRNNRWHRLDLYRPHAALALLSHAVAHFP